MGVVIWWGRDGSVMLEVVDRQRGEGVVIWWGRDGSVMLEVVDRQRGVE